MDYGIIVTLTMLGKSLEPPLVTSEKKVITTFNLIGKDLYCFLKAQGYHLHH